MNKNFQINDTNDKSFIRNKITEILFSIGKKELNNTTSKIIDYYVHNVLATNNESKYVNLVMNGLKLCSKYPVYTNSQINAIEKINQFSNPSFDSKNEELTKKVLQYLHSRDIFKEMYSDYNIKGSSDYEYKKILKEVNDFLEASGLNEAIRKNVVRKDSTLHSNIESISGPLIPSNNEIKSLVKNYLVSKEVEDINKEIKEESLTTSYSNIKKYWKELKKWITDYYLPPQIYLQFINESIYEPIACITQKAILNGNISNDEIKTLTKNIEDLSLDIAKTIVTWNVKLKRTLI